MESIDIREEARRMVEQLPANATWDDLMHAIYVRQTIEAGLADSRQDKTTNISELRRRLGLPPF